MLEILNGLSFAVKLIGVLGLCFIHVIAWTMILLIVGPKDPYEQEIDDQAQMEYLREWRRRKEEKEKSKKNKRRFWKK